MVTGSSKGIGEGIARGLAREGAVMIVHGRNLSRAEEVAHDIVTQGGRAHVVTGDLTKDDEVRRLVERAQAFAGPIDILVNNAGGSGISEDWSTTRPETWASGYDRNTLAAVRVIACVLPKMRNAGWGRIVNVASLAAMMPPPGRPDYSAAKAAMVAMSASLAKAVAGAGITVNTVSPGTIQSGKLEATFRKAAAGQGLAEDAPWAEVERAALPLFAAVPMG
ncbi:SDR family NAD(P)-dependent oxidoreductase, partial [Teichococcus wenyumeiae]|uniref:SDR family NAD(P)-dependent oxidoreductase n=1 Tax=Teichococcus wenyumeiae TaxID=2478470 RepID=UPI001F2334D4